MKHRFLASALCAALCAALCLSPVRAVDVAASFPAINTYAGYTDVEEDAWYAPYAKLCYETGLITGTTGSTFSPEATMTVAQAATLVIRVENILLGGNGVLDQSGPTWYSAAVDRGLQLAMTSGDNRLASRLSYPDSPATRQDFFALMALVVPNDLLTPINQVVSLPDSNDSKVLSFYNAGILSGMNSYGSFQGTLTLRRCEAAAMTARLVRPDLRDRFTLTPMPSLCQISGYLPETVFFEGDPPVTTQAYLEQVQATILQLENLCVEQNIDFNWFNTFGSQTYIEYVKTTAATALGVSPDAGTAAYQSFDPQLFYSQLLDYIQALPDA